MVQGRAAEWLSHDRGGRSQHRAAGDRRVVAQAALDGGQPHPRRGGAARTVAASGRFCRRGAALRAAAGASVHLVELPRSRLVSFKSRAAPRSYLGEPVPRRRAQRSAGAPRQSRLEQGLGPCPGYGGDRRLTR